MIDLPLFGLCAIFFCLIITPLESCIFRFFEKIPFTKILPHLLIANIFSWIAGSLIIRRHAYESDPA